MNNTKKTWTDLQRLLLYLTFTFVSTFLWFWLANPDHATWEDMGQQRQSFMALGMLFPVFGHILTRWITKEGFSYGGEDSSYFGLTLKEGKWKVFLLACLLPWIYAELGNLFELALDPARFDPEYYISLGIEKRLLFLFPMNLLTFPCLP